MEDLEIVGETSAAADVIMLFSNIELAARRPVWQAMSELWLHEEMTDYDLNYIAIRLSDSPFSTVQLQEILENEVRPVVISGQYIMNSEWFVIEENWLEDTILKHLCDVQVASENQSLSTKILKKFGFAARKQKETEAEGGQKVAQYWHGIEKLVMTMREDKNVQNKGPQHNLLAPAIPFGGE